MACSRVNFTLSTQVFYILWDLEVHYHVHNSPLLAPVLNHTNPVHSFPSYFFKTDPFSYYTHSYTFVSLIHVFFPNLVCISFLPMHPTCPINLIFLDSCTLTQPRKVSFLPPKKLPFQTKDRSYNSVVSTKLAASTYTYGLASCSQ
jgi:hypothetical protein